MKKIMIMTAAFAVALVAHAFEWENPGGEALKLKLPHDPAYSFPGGFKAKELPCLMATKWRLTK